MQFKSQIDAVQYILNDPKGELSFTVNEYPASCQGTQAGEARISCLVDETPEEWVTIINPAFERDCDLLLAVVSGDAHLGDIVVLFDEKGDVLRVYGHRMFG